MSGPGPEASKPVPILMYHEVAPRAAASFRKYVVAPSTFRWQMAWLAARGYRSIGFEDLHRAPESLPARPVLITFDDGYADAIRWAVPILARHRFSATFFIVAGLAGGSSRWLLADRGVELALADWAVLRGLVDAGHALGSHSLTHPRLPDLDDDACRRELAESRTLIEDRIGRAVSTVAYPHGAQDARVRRIAADAGYVTGCTVEAGLASPGDDLLALRRVPVNGTETFLDFVWRLRAGERALRSLRLRLRSDAARLRGR